MAPEKKPFSALRGLVVLVGVVALLKAWVILPVQISGTSMAPTLDPGDLRWVLRTGYLFHSPRRGDIVCFWTGRELVVKRIVGLPGETIDMREGMVRINGRVLHEPYLASRGDWSIDRGRLGNDCYAVLGDERTLPNKEHPCYIVKRQRIVGPVL
jgi:signal peptidase I